jgi:hypothetical protein
MVKDLEHLVQKQRTLVQPMMVQLERHKSSSSNSIPSEVSHTTQAQHHQQLCTQPHSISLQLP